MLKRQGINGAKVGMGILCAVCLYSYFFTHLSSFLTYPALVSNSWIVEPLKRWSAQRKEYAMLLQELQTLQKAHQALEEKYAQYEAERAYLNGISEIRAFNKRFMHKGISAQVLARTFSTDGHYFFVHAGSRDRVTIDMIVLADQAIVGKVVEVYPWYSKVALITDAQCKIGAYCTPTRAQGIHEGCNDEKKTQLRFVDHLSEVHKGDLVLSSGHGMIFPEGFLIGKVASVTPQGLYQEVTVTPACWLKEVEYCLLVAKKEVL